MGPMRLFAVLGLALVAGGAGVAAASPPYQQAPPSVEVVVKGLTYAPASVDVAAGGKVTWIFDDGDTPHTVIADDNSFASNPAGQKTGTFEHVFDQARSVNYHCDLHSNMAGTVNVH